MRAYIANTDYDWYTFLAAQPSLDEVNFWRPSGGQVVRLAYGDPFVFKLKKAHGHAVVGFAFFAMFRRLPVAETWAQFGPKNGAPTREAMWARLSAYAFGRASEPYYPLHPVGCDLLVAPAFFPRALWVDGPADWADNTVTGKNYDATTGEGRRIWQACLDRAAHLNTAVRLDPAVAEPHATPSGAATDPAARYGAGRLVQPRLGQGTFRYAVLDAYGQCAVTGEHSLPALEAAHIVPYGEGGEHAVPNGLLLRADVHRLFDAGYVTVTPDYRFRVGGRLRADFSNGRSYYPLDGQPIRLPSDARAHPDRVRLERHNAERFLG